MHDARLAFFPPRHIALQIVDLGLQTAVHAVNLVAKGDKLPVMIVDPVRACARLGLNFLQDFINQDW